MTTARGWALVDRRTGRAWGRPGSSRGTAGRAPGSRGPWRRRTGRGAPGDDRASTSGMRPARRAESAARIGHRPQRRGRGGGQVGLAVGDGRLEHLGQHRRPGGGRRGEGGRLLGRERVGADPLDGLLQRQAESARPGPIGRSGSQPQGLAAPAAGRGSSSASVRRHLPRGRAPCGPCPRSRRRPDRRGTRPGAGGSSRRRRSAPGPGACGWAANGRPVSRAIAACAAASRTPGRRPAEAAGNVRNGTAAASPIRPRAVAASAAMRRVGALERRRPGAGRSSGRAGPCSRTSRSIAPRRETRPPQCLDQEAARRTGPPPGGGGRRNPAPRGVLVRLGDEPRDPLGLGRVPARGRGQLRRPAARANGRVAGSSSSRRNEPTPYRSRIAIRVASSGLALLEPVEVRDRLRGLTGPDQVVGGLPELDRGPRLLGEQLRTGRLGPRRGPASRARRASATRRRRPTRRRHGVRAPCRSDPRSHRPAGRAGHGVRTHGLSPMRSGPGGHAESRGSGGDGGLARIGLTGPDDAFKSRLPGGRDPRRSRGGGPAGRSADRRGSRRRGDGCCSWRP